MSSSTDQSPPTYLPTIDAYNQWAETYDTSPNFLPPLSTHLLLTLLAPLLPTLPARPLLVDLGCGTARTTTLLLTQPGATVLGLDASPAMLDVARQRCEDCFRALPTAQRAHAWDVKLWDILACNDTTSEATPSPTHLPSSADLLTSTLVLEHIPLPHFFRIAASLLRPGGLLVLTNMHAHMGRVTQAGFRTPAGIKIRGLSHAHEIPDVLAAARDAGFELLEGEPVHEVGVTEYDLSEGGVLAHGNVGEGARSAARKWCLNGEKVLFGGVWRFGGGG